MESDTWQRGALLGLIQGRYGLRLDSLRPELFTGARKALAKEILSFRQEHGDWPPRSLLDELARKAEGDGDIKPRELRIEARMIATLDPLTVPLVLSEVKSILKRKALQDAAIAVSELAGGEAEHFGKAREITDSALQAAEEAPEPFRFGEGIVERHDDRRASAGVLIAPTGLPSLDRLKGGGLHGGELGLILGPTKRGKSHFLFSFGAAHLLSGGRVFGISLEMRAKKVSCRFDRAITGMDSHEILANPEQYKRIWTAQIPDPSRLKILDFPRYSITVATVADLFKKELDRHGPTLLLLDYGSILRPISTDTRHLEVGRIHEALSSLAQREKMPIWTPFQTNRLACLMSDTGDVRMEHAGESYEAMQHADLIVTLCQNYHDEIRERIRLSVEGSRESASAVIVVDYDWSRTRITEADAPAEPEHKGSENAHPESRSTPTGGSAELPSAGRRRASVPVEPCS